MDNESGIDEILNAKWIKDDYNTLNIHVHDDKGKIVHAWLALRQNYCDRGHIEFNLDAPGFYIDGSDSFPRFYMNLERAKAEVKEFLLWRIWKHRVNPHSLE